MGDTFQIDFAFLENGTFSIDGEYRESFLVVVAGQVMEEDSAIIVIENEEGTYSTNDSSMTLILDGDIYDVTLFNENEIRVTFEDMWTENEDTFEYHEEIRLIRQ